MDPARPSSPSANLRFPSATPDRSADGTPAPPIVNAPLPHAGRPARHALHALATAAPAAVEARCEPLDVAQRQNILRTLGLTLSPGLAWLSAQKGRDGPGAACTWIEHLAERLRALDPRPPDLDALLRRIEEPRGGAEVQERDLEKYIRLVLGWQQYAVGLAAQQRYGAAKETDGEFLARLWCDYLLDDERAADIRKEIWMSLIIGPMYNASRAVGGSHEPYEGVIVERLRDGHPAEEIIADYQLTDPALKQWVREQCRRIAASGPHSALSTLPGPPRT